jgi:hypothetical protein
LVGDPRILDRVGRVGVAELPLNCGDIPGFLYEVKNNSPLGKIAFIASIDAPSNYKIFYFSTIISSVTEKY